MDVCCSISSIHSTIEGSTCLALVVSDIDLVTVDGNCVNYYKVLFDICHAKYTPVCECTTLVQYINMSCL